MEKFAMRFALLCLISTPFGWAHPFPNIEGEHPPGYQPLNEPSPNYVAPSDALTGRENDEAEVGERAAGSDFHTSNAQEIPYKYQYEEPEGGPAEVEDFGDTTFADPDDKEDPYAFTADTYNENPELPSTVDPNISNESNDGDSQPESSPSDEVATPDDGDYGFPQEGNVPESENSEHKPDTDSYEAKPSSDEGNKYESEPVPQDTYGTFDPEPIPENPYEEEPYTFEPVQEDPSTETFNPEPVSEEPYETTFNSDENVPTTDPNELAENYPSELLSNYPEQSSSSEETTTTTPAPEQEPTTFLQGFDAILKAADAYRISLTEPLRELVGDESGRNSVIVCKTQRTRVVITVAVKKLIQSFNHWVNIGTPREDPHCKQESKDALVAFSVEVDKVAQDLNFMEAENIFLEEIFSLPMTQFKRLERLVIQTLLLFGPQLVEEPKFVRKMAFL